MKTIQILTFLLIGPIRQIIEKELIASLFPSYMQAYRLVPNVLIITPGPGEEKYVLVIARDGSSRARSARLPSSAVTNLFQDA